MLSEYQKLWGTGKRYYSFGAFSNNKFNKRVQKIPLKLDFSCPNRDGSLAKGGCTYCVNKSFNPSYTNAKKSIREQIENGIEFYKSKYKDLNYVAYFQAYSNTYKEIEKLKEYYETALSNPFIDGLIIGTRPDCINEDLLEYLNELNKTNFISLEFGVESSHNKTLELINRCHSFELSVEAIKLANSFGLDVGAHLILGLPFETKEMMTETIQKISKLPLNSVKIHQLQILKHTEMGDKFNNEKDRYFNFDVESYVDFISDIIEFLPYNLVIDRFISESPREMIIWPKWNGMRTYEIIKLIEDRLEEKNHYQGRLFKELK